jgi:hypothetical protein
MRVVWFSIIGVIVAMRAYAQTPVQNKPDAPTSEAPRVEAPKSETQKSGKPTPDAPDVSDMPSPDASVTGTSDAHITALDQDEYARTIVCPKGAPPLVPVVTVARFTFLDSGRIRIDPDGHPRAFAVAFDGALANVQTVDAKRGDALTLGCGSIERNRVYAVSGNAALATLSIFALGDHDAKYLTEYRTRLATEMKQAEREAVRTRIANLSDAIIKARVAFLQPTNQSITDALTAVRALHITLDACGSKSLLAASICEESTNIAELVKALFDVLTELDNEKRTAERAKIVAAAKPAELLAALKPAELSDLASKAQCDRIARYRWLAFRGKVPRLLTVASLPLVDDIAFAPYSERVPPAEHAPAGQHGLLITSIPYGQVVKFAVVQGEKTTLSVATLFSVIVGQGRALLPITGDEPMRITLNESFDSGSQLCPHPPDPVFDEDLPASSKLEHRGYIFNVDRDHKKSVVLCSGKDCTGKEDDKQVQNRLSVTPSRAGTFTLLAEVSAGLRTDLSMLSAPAFKPIGGSDGPDQIYEMQRTTNPADIVSTSILLALNVTHRNLLAAGPSLTTGTSGNAFKQWNFRYGRRLGEGGMLITIGGSVRAIPMPQDYAVGDRISVPRAMATNPPTFRSYFSPEWQVELGFALDLAGVAGLASDAFKAIGGK